VRDVTAIAYFGEDMRNFRLKLRSVLQEDEEAYEKRRRAIEEEHRMRRLRLRAAGGALLVLLGGWAAVGAWRRRRPSGAGGLWAGAATGRGVVAGSYRLERELGRGALGPVF